MIIDLSLKNYEKCLFILSSIPLLSTLARLQCIGMG